MAEGFKRGVEYEIMLVPNIVNITYGRGVGYTFEEEVFEKSISEISATQIRKDMRKKVFDNINSTLSPVSYFS
jgi:hypothetical protein